MSGTADKLRSLEQDIERYDRLLRGMPRDDHGLGADDDYTAANADVRQLRSVIARQYGELKDAIAGAVGGTVQIATGYRNFGDAFLIIVGDATHPMMGTALEACLRSVQMAIGHFDSKGDVEEQPSGSAGRPRLHPKIESSCGKLLNDEHYPQAMFEASKALLQMLQQKSGVKKEGLPLVEEALTPRAPRLAFNALESEADRDEQRRIFDLTHGVVLAIRHMSAHTVGQRSERERALELIGLMSFLAYRIDKARKL